MDKLEEIIAQIVLDSCGDECVEKSCRRAVREALNGAANGDLQVNGTILHVNSEAAEWLRALAAMLEDKS